MKALLALIKKLYGSKALSKTIGTRTNVITLPDKETKRFINSELNIDAASDAAVQKAYQDVEKLIPDIPKMNDQEILTLTGNLRRLDNRLNPPSAEVISIGTKQPVSPTGIKQLVEEAGQKSPPGTLMGDLESRINQLRASGKKLDEIVKDMRPKTTEDYYAETRRAIENPTPEEAAIRAKEKARLSKVFEDIMVKGPGSYDWQREGMVRTAAREILQKNLKAGKLKLTDPYETKMISESRQGGVDPIEVFRREYGEGALEQLDDIADEILPAQSYKEITDVLEREKLFDLKPLSKEAKASAKESQEYADKIMKDVKEGKIKTVQQAYEEGELKGTGLDDLIEGFDDPDKFATGGRVGFAYGSGLKLAKLLQKAGTNLKKAIREAIDNINPTGDKKLDADMAVDDMLETYNIDRDAVDGYDILGAYDEAYKTIATPGSKVMFSPAETKFAKDIGATKMAERIEMMEKYPGIDPKLVDKILIDDNPQRKAEVLATLDEAFTMMKKGMSDDEILTTFKKTPRTKQAGGGLAYLMGL